MKKTCLIAMMLLMVVIAVPQGKDSVTVSVRDLDATIENLKAEIMQKQGALSAFIQLRQIAQAQNVPAPADTTKKETKPKKK